MNEQNRKAIPLANQTIQAGVLPSLIIFVVISTLYILSIIALDRLNLTNYLIIAALGIFGIFISFLPRISKIEIDNSGFVKYLFKGKRHIQWSEITMVDSEWQFHGHGASLHLNINLSNGTRYDLPLSFYSRKKIALLCDAFVSACPHADISDKVAKMAAGNFPWYVY